MSQLASVIELLRTSPETTPLADSIEAGIAEMREAQASLLLTARNAGAREAFNTIRNLVEIKAAEIGAMREDPE